MKQKKYGVVFNAAEGETPAEILIHGPVGKSFWSDGGITGKEFTDALNKIPVGQKVVVGINSQGGAAGEGLAIFNAIKRRSADITARIDGYAISIASVIPLAASKVISPESAIWMMHNAWAWMDGVQGNADDMRELADNANGAADMLDKHDDVIVAAYSGRTGKSENEIRDAMAAETWLTGAEAVEWKLADAQEGEADLEALDFSGVTPNAFLKIPVRAGSLIFAAAGGDALKHKTKPEPNAANPSAPPDAGRAPENKKTNNTDENKMKRQDKIALLNGWGVEVKDEASLTDASIDELLARGKPAAEKPEPQAADPKAEIAEAVQNAVAAAEKRAEQRAEVNRLVDEKRITRAQADKLFKLPADSWDSAIVIARENPVMPVAADPVAVQSDIKAESSPIEIAKHVDSLVKAQGDAVRRGNSDYRSVVVDAASRVAAIYNQHRAKLLTVLNANTIGAGIKRNVILQEVLRAFAIRVLPLRAFSTVYNAVKLEGTDIVGVPYFPLTSTASTDFVAANGYVMGDSTNDSKTVTVDKRKYQPIRFNSSELARQPGLNLMQIAEIKAEKLGVDMVADIMSAITAANYGAASFTGLASTFDSSDIADLKGVCDVANWPDAGRSLVVGSAYDVNLLKDSTVKSALNFGSADPIQNGAIQNILGFKYYNVNGIPANGQNLVGFCVFPSALLVATSPISPSDDVRNFLSAYEMVLEPVTGASFEYRRWGNPDFDETREVIEVNYGFAVGEAAALKRMVSA